MITLIGRTGLIGSNSVTADHGIDMGKPTFTYGFDTWKESNCHAHRNPASKGEIDENVLRIFFDEFAASQGASVNSCATAKADSVRLLCDQRRLWRRGSKEPLQPEGACCQRSRLRPPLRQPHIELRAPARSVFDWGHGGIARDWNANEEAWRSAAVSGSAGGNFLLTYRRQFEQ
jgi:hypothetical protein